MRHHRRLSFNKKGEREQFKHPLLPYPEKTSKMYINKKYELHSEFMFCIPVKPISSVFGCDLDIFVRFTSLVSIAMWLCMIILESLYFYSQGFGNQTYFIIIVAISVASSFIIFGIFCGIIGYIGCTISNAKCIYSFFIQLNIQILINIYALIASLIRGYLFYTCLYILCIISDILFLYPAWSLYMHTKLNSNSSNISKHCGLFADVLSKYEQKLDNKINNEEKSPFIECDYSSFPYRVEKNINMNNKANLFYKERIKSHKTSNSLITDNLEQPNMNSIHSQQDFDDEQKNLIPSIKILNQEINSKNLDYEIINKQLDKNSLSPVNSSINLANETRIFLSWSKPSIRMGKHVTNSSSIQDTDILSQKIYIPEQKQLEYNRKNIYNGL